jgi:thioredoxin-like negative regulator of GroEL
MSEQLCFIGQGTITSATFSGLAPEMSKVIDITDQSFDEEVLKSDIPTEVDFWEPWCNPCRMVKGKQVDELLGLIPNRSGQR